MSNVPRTIKYVKHNCRIKGKSIEDKSLLQIIRFNAVDGTKHYMFIGLKQRAVHYFYEEERAIASKMRTDDLFLYPNIFYIAQAEIMTPKRK